MRGGVEFHIMRSLKWILAVAAVVALVILLRVTVFAPDVVAVRTAEVERGLVEQTVTNTRAGTIKVRRRAELSPQVGGLVVALPHREGDWVEAGAVLVELDSRAQRAELASARTTVIASRAQANEACLAAELAEKELVRVEALHSQGHRLRTEPRSVADRSRSLAGRLCRFAGRGGPGGGQGRSRLEVQVAFTHSAPLRRHHCGAEHRNRGVHHSFAAGTPIPPVIDLLDPASIYVSAPIDEVDAERLRVGQAVRMTVDSRPDHSYCGNARSGRALRPRRSRAEPNRRSRGGGRRSGGHGGCSTGHICRRGGDSGTPGGYAANPGIRRG